MTYLIPPGGVPPTFVIGVPGWGTSPLVYYKQFYPQKNSGKNFMRNIRPPHYSRMKSAIYIYYIGEVSLSHIGSIIWLN